MRARPAEAPAVVTIHSYQTLGSFQWHTLPRDKQSLVWGEGLLSACVKETSLNPQAFEDSYYRREGIVLTGYLHSACRTGPSQMTQLTGTAATRTSCAARQSGEPRRPGAPTPHLECCRAHCPPPHLQPHALLSFARVKQPKSSNAVDFIGFSTFRKL